jgi:hypothetical protein
MISDLTREHAGDERHGESNMWPTLHGGGSPFEFLVRRAATDRSAVEQAGFDPERRDYDNA